MHPKSSRDHAVQNHISSMSKSLLFIYSVFAPAAAIAITTTDDNKLTEEEATVNIVDAVEFSTKVENTRRLNSDEFILDFNNTDLGIAITESSYNGFPVCTVSKILSTDLVVSHQELRIGAIVTKINDTKVDGIPLRDIARLIKESPRPVSIKFRDPSR